MRNYLLLSFIFFIILVSKAFSENYLLKAIQENKDFSTFYELIKIAKYSELFEAKTQFKKIVYIPNNKAFLKLPDKIKNKIKQEDIAKKIIKTHLFSGEVKEVFKDPKKKVLILERFEANGEKVKIFRNKDLFVKEIVNKELDIFAGDHKIIPIDCVMYLQFSSDYEKLTQKQQASSQITSCCILTDEEIEDFVNNQYLSFLMP